MRRKEKKRKAKEGYIGYGEDESFEAYENFDYQSSAQSYQNTSPQRPNNTSRGTPNRNTNENSRIGSLPTNNSRIGSLPSENNRVGSVKSKNYYAEQRKKMNLEKSEYWIMKVIREIMGYLFSGFSKIREGGPEDFDQPSLRLPPNIKKRMERYREFITIRYDSENNYHEKQLSELWKCCFPREPLCERRSNEWKRMGFQYIDPASDFRSAGIFGLQNILFFAKYYNLYFRRMLHRCVEEGGGGTNGGYPFILAALNSVMILMNILGWGIKKSGRNMLAKKRLIDLLFSEPVNWDAKIAKQNRNNVRWAWERDGMKKVEVQSRKKKKKKAPPPSRRKKVEKVKVGVLLDFGGSQEEKEEEEEEEVGMKVMEEEEDEGEDEEEDAMEDENEENVCVLTTRELFCTTFYHLDKHWFDSNASYFMFPEIMKKTTETMEMLLETKFFSLEDIEMYNQGCMKKRRR